MARNGLSLVIAAALILNSGSSARAGWASVEKVRRQEQASVLWWRLRAYEEAALRDYQWHRATAESKIRADDLWDFAQSDALRLRAKSCAAAAQTLGYMVTGFYESAQRLEVSNDWHYYSGLYIEKRAACLNELTVDPKKYRLPRWFGR